MAFTTTGIYRKRDGVEDAPALVLPEPAHLAPVEVLEVLADAIVSFLES